jgi:hypothetical protein
VLKDLNYSSFFTRSSAVDTTFLFKNLDIFLIDNEYDFFSKDFLQNFIYLTANTAKASSLSPLYLNSKTFIKLQGGKKIIFKKNSNSSALTVFNKSLTRSLFNYDFFSLEDLKFINRL